MPGLSLRSAGRRSSPAAVGAWRRGPPAARMPEPHGFSTVTPGQFPRCAMAGTTDGFGRVAREERPARRAPAAAPGRPALLAVPLAAALLGWLPTAPLAATGDLYQVTSERANL